LASLLKSSDVSKTKTTVSIALIYWTLADETANFSHLYVLSRCRGTIRR